LLINYLGSREAQSEVLEFGILKWKWCHIQTDEVKPTYST
jgi:hypothetical protein